MAQTSVASFFNTRKRGIEEDTTVSKNKVLCLERNLKSSDIKDQSENSSRVVYPTTKNQQNDTVEGKLKNGSSIGSIRQGITPQRGRSSKRIQMQNVDGVEAPKLVNFFIGGSLSPQKKAKKPSESTVSLPKSAAAAPTKEENNEECIQNNRGMQTPTKKEPSNRVQEKKHVEKTVMISNNSLNTEELKKKLRGSSKLADLKTSLNKLRNGFDKLDQMEKRRLAPSTAVRENSSTAGEGKTLKPFRNIELEILSPKKLLTSPMKLKDSPMKNMLIGSPKILSPRKILFSPTKSSPVKAPAYERFQNLTDVGTPNLQLPFKYRYILEIFKAVDTVCAMFFNRKEKITFKKMKPAVQRILRKNVYETHLAQIHKLMPNAYKFAQEKTRNFGSTSKQDYYQLVITPIVKEEKGDLSQLTLSPQVLIERTKKMTELLTDLVFKEHEIFLQNLEVPMNLTRGAIKRWHPDFPIESVPDVEQGEIPLPPNVERYSTAKDVLSTARNLFNCNTPMERALERLEVKKKEEKLKQMQHKEYQESKIEATPQNGNEIANDERKKQVIPDSTASLLKGVPKSLLEKIRAKQAAKALDTMTRRPSQERDAVKYSRLPEIARHVRNVFVTEKKGVLPLEIVLLKIQNSYKATISLKEVEELLRLIEKEMPFWLSFHDIRCMMFVKVNRDGDITSVIDKLQKLASQKAQIQ